MTTRSKTFTWSDPAEALAKAAGLSGLEAMQAIRDGALPAPPMAVLMNCDITEVEPGRVVFTCTPGEEHYNPLGTVHGGLACTLLDTVVGCAAHTTLDAGAGYTSIELKASYLRPITLASGTLTATGWVVKGGRRIIFADGEIHDEHGNLVATASSSLLVLTR